MNIYNHEQKFNDSKYTKWYYGIIERAEILLLSLIFIMKNIIYCQNLFFRCIKTAKKI